MHLSTLPKCCLMLWSRLAVFLLFLIPDTDRNNTTKTRVFFLVSNVKSTQTDLSGLLVTPTIWGTCEYSLHCQYWFTNQRLVKTYTPVTLFCFQFFRWEQDQMYVQVRPLRQFKYPWNCIYLYLIVFINERLTQASSDLFSCCEILISLLRNHTVVLVWFTYL